jgi:cytochrome c oxidase subunit III
MSAEALHHHHEVLDAHTHVSHQFEDRAQQDECYIVGMWTFLVTEIMFFGALFIAYTVYRLLYTADVAAASHELNVKLGFVNTLILLTSSLTMAFAVRNAMLKRKGPLLLALGLTLLCAFGFLVVKTFEYGSKFQHHLVPGYDFQWPPHGAHEAGSGVPGGATHAPPAGAPATDAAGASHGADSVPAVESRARGTDHATDHNGGAALERVGGTTEKPNYSTTQKDHAELYIGLYFIMTGLHGLHVVIGILILGVMWVMIKFDHPAVADFMPLEMAGLYWHFVDIVWIFLYPLLYLIQPQSFFPLWPLLK